MPSPARLNYDNDSSSASREPTTNTDSEAQSYYGAILNLQSGTYYHPNPMSYRHDTQGKSIYTRAL